MGEDKTAEPVCSTLACYKCSNLASAGAGGIHCHCPLPVLSISRTWNPQVTQNNPLLICSS